MDFNIIVDYIKNNWVEILGAVSCLIYMILQYKASPRMWYVGFFMCIFNFLVYIDKGVYAMAAFQVYQFSTAVYGLYVWKFGGKKTAENNEKTATDNAEIADDRSKEQPITKMSAKVFAITSLIILLIWVGTGFLLKSTTDSEVPWMDAFTLAVSCIAVWVLARKYLEQWWYWIAYDICFIVLGLMSGMYFYAALSLIYAVIGVMGYMKWLKIYRESGGHR